MKTRLVDWLRKNRSLLLRVAGTVLAVVLIVVLVREGGWDEVLGALRQMSPARLLISLILVLISRFFVSLRWHILLRSGNVNIPFSRSLALTFTGLFANNFLPTTIGGDVVRLAGAMQLGYDRAVCLASIAADRLMGALGNAFTLFFGLIPTLHTLGNGTAVQSIALSGWWSQAWRFVGRTFQTFVVWLSRPMALLGALACTWGHMLCTVTTMYVLIEGLGGHVDFWLLAGLWSLTYFITLVPISINGYGVQELSLTFLLSSVGGLSTAVSLTVAVLIRAMYVGVSLGGAFFLPGILAAMNEKRGPGEPEG
ncbi:MAG TPA: lysylphosphatidylglycerol synthase transmembrane domain-containing protein [Anaerolineales bacterium]|nr:lysylphosphatidylglycerol synthase transmembrane domain-containing protein [Anaerolineales bacterium]